MNLYFFILSILPIIMGIYYIIYFFKHIYYRFNNNIFYLPLFIYWGVYPFLVNNSYFPYPYLVQILGLIAILSSFSSFFLTKKTIYFNRYELFFVGIILISIFVIEFRSFYNTGLSNIIFLFLMTFTFYNSDIMRDTRIPTLILLKNSVILSFLSIIEFVLFKTRVSVTLANPNYLAIYIVLGLLVVIFSKKKKKLISGLLIIVAIILTQSTAVIISMFFPFIILAIKKFKFTYKIILPITLFLILIGSYIGITQSKFTNSTNLITDFNILKASDTIRFDIWKIAMDIFLENPFFGIGYNQFQPVMVKYSVFYSGFYTTDIGFVTHNDYVRILTELGILGMCVFIRYIIVSFKYSLKFYNETIKMAYLSAILIILFFSFTHNNINSLLFWIILAYPIYIKK